MNPRSLWIALGAARPAAAAVTARAGKVRALRRWRSLAACGVAAALLGLGAASQAAPVSYAFTGVFDVFNGSSNIYTDKPFEGSFTYDPAIAPLDQAQAGAAVYEALIAFDLRILEVPSAFALRLGLASGTPTARIGIDEATNGAPSDAFRISVSSGPRAFIDSPLPWDAFLVDFALERVIGSVFDDALRLPPTLDLADFDRTHVELRLVSGSALFTVDGRITSLVRIDTPPAELSEPGTLELLAMAAGGLSAALRRREGAARPARYVL